MDRPIKRVAIRNVIHWKYRAAIQSWVGRSALLPGNMPIPLCARVWTRSMLPKKRNEMPRIKKKPSVIARRVFQMMMKIDSATAIPASSTIP